MKKRVIAVLLAAMMVVPTGYQGVSAAEYETESVAAEESEVTEEAEETRTAIRARRPILSTS